jgi:hypothetical protein
MSTIKFHETTTATPEQFVAGVHRFRAGRSELFVHTLESVEARNGGATA